MRKREGKKKKGKEGKKGGGRKKGGRGKKEEKGKRKEKEKGEKENGEKEKRGKKGKKNTGKREKGEKGGEMTNGKRQKRKKKKEEKKNTTEKENRTQERGREGKAGICPGAQRRPRALRNVGGPAAPGCAAPRPRRNAGVRGPGRGRAGRRQATSGRCHLAPAGSPCAGVLFLCVGMRVFLSPKGSPVSAGWGRWGEMPSIHPLCLILPASLPSRGSPAL